jgi:hypothetical protein
MTEVLKESQRNGRDVNGKLLVTALLINARDDTGLDSGSAVQKRKPGLVLSSAEEKARASNERARRAEVAAGLAAAQVMTILQPLH